MRLPLLCVYRELDSDVLVVQPADRASDTTRPMVAPPLLAFFLPLDSYRVDRTCAESVSLRWICRSARTAGHRQIPSRGSAIHTIPSQVERDIGSIADELKGEVPCGFHRAEGRRQSAAGRYRAGMRR